MEEEDENNSFEIIESLKEIYKPHKKIKKRSISPYSQSLNELEKSSLKRRVNPINKLSLTTQLPSLKRKEITKDEFATKKVLVPYADNYFLVEESLRFLNEWSPHKKDSLASTTPISVGVGGVVTKSSSPGMLLSSTSSPSLSFPLSKPQSNTQSKQQQQSTVITMMKRRYPRFCEGLLFDEDPKSYKVRSDLWLVRIIEEIYDSSFSECSKSVSSHRVRNRNNLDLGALDSFPQSARRYISQKYR